MDALGCPYSPRIRSLRDTYYRQILCSVSELLMASVALMVGGALVNALAFSGSNYLFSKLGHSGIDEERKWHDLAIEQLQTAQAAWSRRRIERLDWINKELRSQHHAVQTYHDVSEAMHAYNRVTGRTLDPLGPRPQLSDFSTPSNAQKDREIAFVVLGMAATGLVAYKIAR